MTQLTDQTDQTEFEAAFAEFSSGNPGAAPSDMPVDDEEAGSDKAAAAAQPGAEEDNPGPGDQVADLDSFINDLPPEVKARFDQLQDENESLQHKFSSNQGRLTAYQRQVADLQSEIDSIRAGSTTGKDAPAEADIIAAMNGNDEQWEKFSKDYPEIAEAIDSRSDKLAATIKSEVQETLRPVVQQHERTAKKEAEDAKAASEASVSQLYPTWKDEVLTDDFRGWLHQQSPGVFGLAASDDDRDAILLMEKYDEHRASSGLPSIKVISEAPIEPGGEQDQTQQTTSQLSAKRNMQLESGANVDTPSQPVNTGTDQDEFDATFNYYARKSDEKRQAGAR